MRARLRLYLLGNRLNLGDRSMFSRAFGSDSTNLRSIILTSLIGCAAPFRCSVPLSKILSFWGIPWHIFRLCVSSTPFMKRSSDYGFEHSVIWPTNAEKMCSNIVNFAVLGVALDAKSHARTTWHGINRFNQNVDGISAEIC